MNDLGGEPTFPSMLGNPQQISKLLLPGRFSVVFVVFCQAFLFPKSAECMKIFFTYTLAPRVDWQIFHSYTGFLG